MALELLKKIRVLAKRRRQKIGEEPLIIEVSLQALPLASGRSHPRDYHHPNPTV